MKKLKSALCNCRGMSIPEILIATFLTGVLAAAGFHFYVTMHNSSLTQQDISDMQTISRNVLDDIAANAKNAGFKLAGHAPFAINGDSLEVYFSGSQPVDTIRYYLVEYNSSEYNNLPGLPGGQKVYHLMRQLNSDVAARFASGIGDIDYTSSGTEELTVTVVVVAPRPDEDYATNGGYRLFSSVQSVSPRNSTL